MGFSLFIQTLWEMPIWFFSVLVTVVVSITVHELAHGIAAVKLGDRTPIDTGHMTLNPLVHMGPFSLMVLMIAGIAWGAMPIDPTRLKGRYAEAIVAFAGPASNLVMSLAAILVLAVWLNTAGPQPEVETPRPPLARVIFGDKPESAGIRQADVWQWVMPVREGDTNDSAPLAQNTRFFLFIFATTNLVLFLFNLVPVPPLDGSHILANFHRGYGRFIGEPNNQGILLLGMVFAFSLSSRLWPAVYDWTLRALVAAA